jgi:hypothetical protein
MKRLCILILILTVRYATAQVEQNLFISERVTTIKLNDKWGFVDGSDYAFPFIDGLANVKLDGKWGFIDRTGTETIPVKYDFAEHLSPGVVKVKLNDNYGLIDKFGNELLPIECEYLKYYSGVDCSSSN